MSLTHEQALELLELKAGAGAEQVFACAEERRKALRASLDAAPTDALKEKFRARLAQLEEAVELLVGSAGPGLSATKMADLPGLAAMRTQMTGGASGGSENLPVAVGDTLMDRYEIRGVIGMGGMGVVYRAYDRNRDADIALKVMVPALMTDAAARDRFLAEARLSSSLSHPNIVNVFDVQQAGELYFLTMELLEGQSLRSYLSALRQARQSVAVDRAVEIARKVGDALQYAHRHTVHRDVKPENVFIGEDGEIKLMDFGIARLLRNSQMTQTGASLGTAYYMAPEQLAGEKTVDGRADQYALAVMLYEMLTGAIPQGRVESARAVRKDIPRKLSDAVDRAMAPKPEMRFPDMAAFVAALGGARGRMALPKPALHAGAVVAAIVAIVLLLPALGGVWDTLRPRSEGEIAALRADAQALDAEARSVEARLALAREVVQELPRSLARDERETIPGQILERYASGYLAAIRRIDTDADYLAAQSRLTEAREQLRAGNLDGAIAGLTGVVNVFDRIEKTFTRTEMSELAKSVTPEVMQLFERYKVRRKSSTGVSDFDSALAESLDSGWMRDIELYKGDSLTVELPLPTALRPLTGDRSAWLLYIARDRGRAEASCFWAMERPRVRLSACAAFDLSMVEAPKADRKGPRVEEWEVVSALQNGTALPLDYAEAERWLATAGYSAMLDTPGRKIAALKWRVVPAARVLDYLARWHRDERDWWFGDTAPVPERAEVYRHNVAYLWAKLAYETGHSPAEIHAQYRPLVAPLRAEDLWGFEGVDQIAPDAFVTRALVPSCIRGRNGFPDADCFRFLATLSPKGPSARETYLNSAVELHMAGLLEPRGQAGVDALAEYASVSGYDLDAKVKGSLVSHAVHAWATNLAEMPESFRREIYGRVEARIDDPATESDFLYTLLQLQATGFGTEPVFDDVLRRLEDRSVWFQFVTYQNLQQYFRHGCGVTPADPDRAERLQALLVESAQRVEGPDYADWQNERAQMAVASALFFGRGVAQDQQRAITLGEQLLTEFGNKKSLVLWLASRYLALAEENAQFYERGRELISEAVRAESSPSFTALAQLRFVEGDKAQAVLLQQRAIREHELSNTFPYRCDSQNILQDLNDDLARYRASHD